MIASKKSYSLDKQVKIWFGLAMAYLKSFVIF